MTTIAEQMQQADIQEAEKALMRRAKTMNQEERDLLMRYLKMTGAIELATKIFGIESLEIQERKTHIHIPEPDKKIYRGVEHGEKGWNLEQLSEGEINLLLKAFFQNPSERQYIVKVFFHKNGFLKKTSGNIINYLSEAEKLFRVASKTQRKTLSLVHQHKNQETPTTEGVNDNNFIPMIDRIGSEEPGYFNYIHEVYKARLEFIESLFIETIRHLAEEPQNHIWAIDPERNPIHIPSHLQSQVDLIRSICEFHKMIDPNFPLLHTLIHSTLGSWILIYKGFSAPIYTVREIIGK